MKKIIYCYICSNDEASYMDVDCGLCKESHDLCSTCYELGHNENYGGLNNTGVYWGDEYIISKKDELLKKLDDIDNDDENLEMLERAMEYYCGNYDICEGYKHAIRLTIEDQYNNHLGEQAPDDLDKLSDILNGAI